MMDKESPRFNGQKNRIDISAATLYRSCHNEVRSVRRGPLAAYWTPDPLLPPDQLLQYIHRAEQAPDTYILKEDRRTRVMRARLMDMDVIIKQYRLTSPIERVKYLFRCSPARRFWAAARTMQAMNIPTPSPLGIVEEYHRGVPVRSCMISEYMCGSLTVRQWLESKSKHLSAADKAQFSRQLLELLQKIYACGLYHKDTKCENILVAHPEEHELRTLLWIDLECVQCKTKPSRHDIIRNLVQLNGSVCRVVSTDDRLTFLHHLATGLPWLKQESTVRKIHSWTARRLEKEQHETR